MKKSLFFLQSKKYDMFLEDFAFKLYYLNITITCNKCKAFCGPLEVYRGPLVGPGPPG